MKYIITEKQHKLITEQNDNILDIPFSVFNYDWNLLQTYIKKRGNPLYRLTGDINLVDYTDIKSLGSLYSVRGTLDLYYLDIESLGMLTSVDGHLILSVTKKLKSLGNLTSVGESLFLVKSKVESLGNLTSIGGECQMELTPIKTLGNLTSVGKSLDASGSDLKSFGNLSFVGKNLFLQETPISDKYVFNYKDSEKEIRKKIQIGEQIYW